MIKNSCLNCEFSEPVPNMANLGTTVNECRLQPPQVLAVPTPQGLQILSMFPQVNENMECSHYLMEIENAAINSSD